MSTHDSISRYGQGRTWGARWRLAWRSLPAVGPWLRGAGRPVRPGRRERRGLNAIDRALTAEMPQLALMFDVFAQLAAGESRDGAERLTRSARRGPRSRRVHVALLVAFASLMALCVTLSLRVNPASGSCQDSANSAWFASKTGRAPAAHAPVRLPGCHAYPVYSK